jgi:hypothetical protein
VTGNSGKRSLPPIPHSDHLRKQAKARLAVMRSKLPTARLADAQLMIAGEYGFASWAALQAAVARRAASPLGQRARILAAHVAPLYPERYHQDALLESEADVHTNLRFFMAGAATQIGFLFAALVGVALLLVTPAQIHMAHAVLAGLGAAR